MNLIYFILWASRSLTELMYKINIQKTTGTHTSVLVTSCYQTVYIISERIVLYK